MRIAIIHNQFSSGGGMEAYMLGLVRGFLRDGDDVHIHTYKVDKDFAASWTCNIHKKNLFYLPRRWKKYLFLKTYNEHFERKEYDLSIALTRTSAPDIAIIGGVHPASIATDTGKRHFLKRFHDVKEIQYEGAMFERVPMVVAHSQFIAADIIKFYPEMDSSKVSVVYPPIDNDFFKQIATSSNKSISREYGVDSSKMSLLFASTGHKRKGLAELLQAFRKLDARKYELLIVGEGLRGFSNIPTNVRYLGYVKNLSALYSVVNYTILPSHYEPFGLAVIESLECGTPVIITKNVGAAELLSEEEAVILPDNQPATLVQAITQLTKRSVPPGFAEKHGLLLSDHIKKLKQLVS
jgi:glycosyltransferase involved in cell wall biosynthesis